MTFGNLGAPNIKAIMAPRTAIINANQPRANAQSKLNSVRRSSSHTIAVYVAMAINKKIAEIEKKMLS